MTIDPGYRLRAIGLAVALLLPGAARAASDTVVLAEIFGPRAGWALETDDAFVLTKAGCLEMLTRIDFDGTVKPGLATTWSQPAPNAWDFTLRQGVTFGDGRKLDAEAVVGALSRVLKAAAPPRSFNPRLVSGVSVIDAQTVRITTPSPSVLTPLRVAGPSTGILSPAALQGERPNPIRACTGPFNAVGEVPRQALKLDRNPAYWGGAANYAHAELRFTPDGQVRATMVQTGEVQIATLIPATALRAPPANVRVVATDLPRVTSLYLNTAKPPFDDVRVRRAIQAAIDTSAIAASVYEGLAKPALGPFAREEPWAQSGAMPVKADVARARALLAEAGVKPESLPFEILGYTERSEMGDLAAVIQAELGEVGIKATVRIAGYAALEPDVLAGKFDSMLLSRNHMIDVPDPGAFLIADYGCKGGYNLSHFCRPALDAQLDAATAEPEAAKRFVVYAEVARMLQDEAVSVFIVHEQQRDAVSTAVAGFRTHPLAHYILTRDLKAAN